MLRRLPPSLIAAWSILALSVAGDVGGLCRAAENEAPAASLADLLPASTVAYAEITRTRDVLEPALGDRARQLLAGFEPYRKMLESKQFETLEAVVSLLEKKLGASWQETLQTLTGGGAATAFMFDQQALVVLVRSRSAEQLQKLHDALVELVEDDAAGKGRESPVKSEDYRGVQGWTFGKNEAHAILGDVLVLSNKAEALKAIVDLREDDEPTLADDATFQAARKLSADDATGFGFLRLGLMKLLAGAAEVFGEKSNNPAVELLAGGLLDRIPQADYVALGLDVDGDRLRLSARLPHGAKTDALSPTRRWYFAPKPSESAAVPLEVPRLVASLTAYRDMSGLWSARNELFDEKVNVGLTQADTNLGLYFSGRDFGTQVLGELSPRWRFVAASHDFAAAGEPVPALKLPGFAVVWELLHPDEFGPHLQMAFQNIVGIVNITGAQNGRPQLLLKTEKRGPAEIHYGTYLTVGEVPSVDAPLHFNFRPAAAQVGKHFVVGTHVSLVRDLADVLANQPAVPTTADNLRLEIRAPQLAHVLESNRTLIIGRTMLSSGGDKAKATERLDAGLSLLRLLDAVQVRLTDAPRTLSLQAELRIHP